MNRVRQVSQVRQMVYQPLDPARRAVERMSFARLRRLNDGGTQRADFHVLALVEAGGGQVQLDFETHPLKAGTVVWIPRGTVHQWSDLAGLEGQIVLFIPTAPATAASRQVLAAATRAGSWSLPVEIRDVVDAALTHLRLEVETVVSAASIDASASGTSKAPSAPSTAPEPAETPRLVLSALLIRVLRAPRHRGSEELFERFQRLVETDFRRHHDAAHYARALGYAPRTLSRAVLAATGITAKTYLAERLVLEAKRLLAHDRFSAARCAAALGFADASNFSAFFTRTTGRRPGAWQAEH